MLIYHPNINQDTLELCLSTTDEKDWKATNSLYNILLNLKFIIIEPDITYVPNTDKNISCT